MTLRKYSNDLLHNISNKVNVFEQKFEAVKWAIRHSFEIFILNI